MCCVHVPQDGDIEHTLEKIIFSLYIHWSHFSLYRYWKFVFGKQFIINFHWALIIQPTKAAGRAGVLHIFHYAEDYRWTHFEQTLNNSGTVLNANFYFTLQSPCKKPLRGELESNRDGMRAHERFSITHIVVYSMGIPNI